MPDSSHRQKILLEHSQHLSVLHLLQQKKDKIFQCCGRRPAIAVFWSSAAEVLKCAEKMHLPAKVCRNADLSELIV